MLLTYTEGQVSERKLSGPSMASPVSSIAAILFATAFFLMGNGLIGTLTPLRAHAQGFSDIAVGALGTWYFLGFVVGCFAGRRLLSRVGHIRAFAVAAVLVAASVLIQPIWNNASIWFVARGIGLCIANLYMAVESWLNDRASNETAGGSSPLCRGQFERALLGQWLLLLAPPTVSNCSALPPLRIACVSRPGPDAAAGNRRRRAAALALNACSPFRPSAPRGASPWGWPMAPSGRLRRLCPFAGLLDLALALFMSAFIIGGAFIQWPLGRISDRFDRRWVIAIVSAIACTGGIALAILARTPLRTSPVLFALIAAYGAAMLPLYSLSIAHANDRLPRAEFVEASAGLLLINAGASVVGPLLGALVISAGGKPALFLYTAVVHALMVVFTTTRIFAREAPRDETREPFEPVPQGSPASLPLDPRAPEHAS